ncbi:hypothetical protein GWK47_035100 [Chionoecetes opilio]|uniref:Uncharacterized protein n=1 Tax=Chionoecetes opilio TaxID=41210 RepID=A0A8J4YH87_CHIOP|nr:hypothetical protein GWK47_035100 [Chionoecetes opilio]
METWNGGSSGLSKRCAACQKYGIGYCYGNIKTHKPGNKLRPKISQIPDADVPPREETVGPILTPYTPKCLQPSISIRVFRHTQNPQRQRITCKRGNCEVLPFSYIGMTTTKLSRRLTCHLTSGTPKKHLLEKHGITITRHFLEENTEMVYMCADVRRLPIFRSTVHKRYQSKINVQAYDLQALPSMRRTKSSDIQPAEMQSREEQKSSTNQRRPLTRAAARLL